MPGADTGIDLDSEDVPVLLSRLEQRLLEKLADLSDQLQALSRTNVGPSQKHAHFGPSIRASLTSQEGKKTKRASVQKTNSNASDEASASLNGHDSDSRPITTSPSGGICLHKMPRSLDEPSHKSKSVWKKIGTKPSEAAKAFIQETLSKAQKKKMTKLNTIPSAEEAGETTRVPRTPLAGIDVVLDLKQDKHDKSMGHIASTATQSCWWNPHSENNMWLMSAVKKAEQIRDSVHDVLLAKGWVNHEIQGIQGLASRHNSNREMQLSFVERLAVNPSFEMCCSLMIILNAALLGYQTQCKADSLNGVDESQWQETAQTLFTIFFTLEVLFRMYAWRLNFFVSKDWGWNVFDLLVVGISVVEVIINLNHDGSAANLSGVRVIRILRLVRVVRFIRVVRFFSELRMMIYSSLKAVRPFLWALGILLLIIYMFAIVITQSVSDYRLDHPNSDVREMQRFYGSLAESVYTLFMVISGGVSWIQPADELILVHWSFAVWMSLYVSFVVFAVLNIVTGIFIQSAMKSAEADQDLVIQEELHHQDSLAQGFLEVFHQLDEDNSGYIDADEFERHVSDYRVRAFLNHLGLDVAEAQGLFRLLDISGTGRVYAKEFVVGCQQLKGPAKNVDVATLLFQNKRMMALWAVFMSYVEDQFAIIVQGQHSDDTLSRFSSRATSPVTATGTVVGGASSRQFAPPASSAIVNGASSRQFASPTSSVPPMYESI